MFILLMKLPHQSCMSFFIGASFRIIFYVVDNRVIVKKYIHIK